MEIDFKIHLKTYFGLYSASNAIIDLEKDYSLEIIKTPGHSWHPSLNIKLKYKDNQSNLRIVFSIMISENPSGCGSAFLYKYSLNNYPFYTKEINDIILKISKDLGIAIFECYKENGCGTFMTTIGESYYGSDVYKFFMSLGFTVKSEYLNYRHGSDYTQRLLVRNHGEI